MSGMTLRWKPKWEEIAKLPRVSWRSLSQNLKMGENKNRLVLSGGDGPMPDDSPDVTGDFGLERPPSRIVNGDIVGSDIYVAANFFDFGFDELARFSECYFLTR